MDDRARTRRRVLATAGSGLALGLAGCFDQSDGTPTDTATGTPTGTATDTATATDTPAETTEDEGPGYVSNHWHGRLFFEVNGELVNFDQPKYYLENLQEEHPDTVYFHFHKNSDPSEPAHGPNEWSNEKKIITFQRALNLLPDIGYQQKGGEHVVTYKGTTYDARQSGTSISVKEGDRQLDPTSYEVQHGDHYYVQVTSENSKRSAQPSHDGADLGTLLFDMNNLRIDFSRDRFLGPEAGSQAFHFHDDGNPYMWYKEGQTTLANALNTLPGISYSKKSGNHVIEYQDEKWPGYSRTFDGSASENEILIRERTTDVDPMSYEPKAGDVIWVYVKSDFLHENEH